MSKDSAAKQFVLVLRSDLSEMAKVEVFLTRVNRTLRLDEVEFNKLFLATSEAVTNAIIHGNKRDARKKVTVTCHVGARTITVRVRDEGEGLDLRRLPNPLAKENLLNENGRGIFLIRTVMDSVKWRKRKGTEVIMTLKKKSPRR